jgi:hypothetical protein
MTPSSTRRAPSVTSAEEERPPTRDVLRIVGGGVTGKKVNAPVPNSWFGSPSIDSAAFIPHSKFGFMCTVLKPDLDTP